LGSFTRHFVTKSWNSGEKLLSATCQSRAQLSFQFFFLKEKKKKYRGQRVEGEGREEEGSPTFVEGGGGLVRDHDHRQHGADRVVWGLRKSGLAIQQALFSHRP
jgi:hypothetical protein